MAPKSSLAEYRRKRDFQRTPEPQARSEAPGRKSIFVIQKHDATSLHYDFRLEVEGVLKSWAVPKGPSTDPREKRLAMPTEDHPLEYAAFEGVIPEGEYGAGPVIVWDLGTYRNLKKKGEREIPLSQCIAEGHLTVWLNGQKIQGGYALTRVARDKRERWILVKMKDRKADAARDPVSTEPRSVLGGLTIEELAAHPPKKHPLAEKIPPKTS